MLRRTGHRPAHLYRPQALYFVTAHTVRGTQPFSTPGRRASLLGVLDRVTHDAERSLYAWFIGGDHYHVLLGCAEDIPVLPLLGAKAAGVEARFDIGRWANRVHSVATLLLNRMDGTPGRKLFSQYWDRCIRSEGEFYGTVNYIHQNPVKHGLVQTLDGARAYEHCSLGQFFARYGAEWVGECFARYPVADYTSPYLDEED